MPYLFDAQKDEAEEQGLRDAVHYSSTMSLKNFVGYLNYAITRHAKTWLKKNGQRYFSLCAIVGTIICSVFELYRRVVAPYEDTKIKENGDV